MEKLEIKDSRTEVLFNLLKNNQFSENDIIDYDCLRVFSTLFNSFNKGRNRSFNEYLLDGGGCKLWRIEKEILHLLLKSDSSNIEHELKLPFAHFFIDNNFVIDKDRIFGPYVKIYSDMDKEKNKDIVKLNKDEEYALIAYTTFNVKEALIDYIEFIINLTTGEIHYQNQNQDDVKKLNESIKNMVLNLLLFLNDPRVTYVVQEENHNNERRMKKGLLPIPSLLKTQIEYTFSQQIEKIYLNGLSQNKLGYSFWVRGFWRKLESPFYKNKQGQKVWILPHIRGSGLLVDQVFEVVKNDQYN